MLSRTFKSLLMVTALCAPASALVAPTLGWAQPDAEATSYSIAAQDLRAALTQLAETSGREIQFSQAAVKGKTSTAVVNAHGFKDAIDTLLTGTGLTATVHDDGSVSISDAKVTAVRDLIITGRRNRSAAIQQLRAPNTIAVLTAEDVARTPDQNVAEALSRLPGVTVLDAGYANTNGVQVDEAARGQGNYVELRGMDAQYNVNLVNGVEVAQGQPYSREVQLNLLPPTGLQKLEVTKVSTAAQDGDAIGGTLNFVTPNAYDFGKTHGSLTATGSINDRALDYGLNGGGGGLSGDFSHKFGDHEQFGVYVGAYYSKTNFANSVVDGIYPAQINGEYTFALQNANGGSAAGYNPSQNLTLLGVQAGLSQGFTELYGANISLDWHPTTNITAYVRASFAKNNTQQASSYSQLYADSVSTTQIGTSGLYTPLITSVQPRFYYETNPEQAQLQTYLIGGSGQFDRLHLSGNIFGSYADNNEPNHIELSGRLNEYSAAFPFSGSNLFTYGSGAPLPLLSASQLAAVGDIADYGARRSGELTAEFSNQWKFGAGFDGRYDLDSGIFKSISFGFKEVGSVREHTVRDYTTAKIDQTGINANDPSFGSLGFLDGSVSAVVPGIYNFPIPLINSSKLWTLFNNAVAAQGGLNALSDQCDNLPNNTYNCDTQRGSEYTTSVYVSGLIKVGNVEIIPGVRFEHIDIKNVYWDTPHNSSGAELPGYFTSDKSSYDKPLPSLLVNYRPDPQTVYRASAWTSYVAPSMFQLGGGEQYSVSQDSKSVFITQGNPKLKTINAFNLDASGEWTNSQGGYASAAVFYKQLKDFIYDSINGFTNGITGTPTIVNGLIATISTPESGHGGSVYGLELAGRQKFTAMPAPFDGLGIAGNLTYEQSSVNPGGGLSKNERLLNQPNWSANAQLFYEKGPYHADLSYRYQGDYVGGYATINGSSAFDTWIHANSKLDLHLGYNLPYGLHADFSASNLLNADSYDASIGKNSNIIPSYIISGRTFIFKLSYTY
jgi:TonB-dependent receptor